MENFEAWLRAETPQDAKPICVAFNAPFDWMFIIDYFYRYLGRNPLGHNAVDIKSFYMAHAGVTWAETGSNLVRARYLHEREFTHHALRDALDQAEIFEKMLAESRQKNLPPNE
jgi:inhibitor of KinA sporulation pathway (predicted exonuclease)